MARGQQQGLEGRARWETGRARWGRTSSALSSPSDGGSHTLLPSPWALCRRWPARAARQPARRRPSVLTDWFGAKCYWYDIATAEGKSCYGDFDGFYNCFYRAVELLHCGPPRGGELSGGNLFTFWLPRAAQTGRLRLHAPDQCWTRRSPLNRALPVPGLTRNRILTTFTRF